MPSDLIRGWTPVRAKKRVKRKSPGRRDRVKDGVKAFALLVPAEACIDVVSEIVGV